MQFEFLVWVIDLYGMTEIAGDALLGNDVAVRNVITERPEWFMAGLTPVDSLGVFLSFSQFEERNILFAREMSMGRILPLDIMLFMTLLAGFGRF